MRIDDRAMARLIERSEDLQRDAMVATRAPLAELTDAGRARQARSDDLDEIREFQSRRRSLLRGALLAGGALATAGFAGPILALSESAAWADTSTDIQMLQTAAAIENLAVATYGVALTLDFIGGAKAIPVVKAFVDKTKSQHQEHADAFNAAVTQLGGKTQPNPDPVLLGVVNKAKPTLTAPGPVLDLAIRLETDAAQTYVASTGAVADGNVRKVFASVMGIEAQHAAILLAVKALVAGGAPEAVRLPPPLDKLPSAAGSVGFPDTFYKTDQARPAQEGAIK